MMTRMNENQLFQAALGLQPPWLVDRCTFDESAGRLDIHLDFPRGSVFSCPVCGVHCKAYDTDQLTWRHLNFFQHQTFLHARTPRVDCSQCGVHRVAVPWARPDSGFTLLFEALVLMLVKSMPVLATARLVNEHDTVIWRIVHHYVTRPAPGPTILRSPRSAWMKPLPGAARNMFLFLSTLNNA